MAKHKKQRRKRKKKDKKYYLKDEKYHLLKKKILKNNNIIWNPVDIKFSKKKSNSWFTLKEYKTDTHDFNLNKIVYPESNKDENSENKRTIKIELLLTQKQKVKMQRWMTGYIEMYNKTLRLIKDRRKNNLPLILNWQILRTYYLRRARNIIANKYSVVPENKTKNKLVKCKTINIHSLDGAIQLACANYQSALTNMRNGNINHFKIRYWNKNRMRKVLTVYHNAIRKTSIFSSVFKTIKCFYNKRTFDLNSIVTDKKYNSECKILYDGIVKKYFLLLPETIQNENIIHDKKIISLDPGVRTFMTGISEDEVIKIGTNTISSLLYYSKKINKLDKIFPQETKKKKQLRILYNGKMMNKVDDLHWKTIKYLTDKYDTILVGDLSAKGIISNEISSLKKNLKVVALRLSFSKFRDRLKNKCDVKGCKFIKVDEHYTSKTCSICGSYKGDLGGNKIYNCNNCRCVFDRDVNGARNILMRMT